ncbi:MAG: hypothetical protein RL033_758 [Pseudomonadota bacterium]
MRSAVSLLLLAGLGCTQPQTTRSLQPGSAVPSGGAPGQAPDATVREGAQAPLRSLRIASWNLEWLHRRDGAGPVPRRSEDYVRLSHYADRLAADVIAVQEVDGAEALQRVFDGSRYALQLAQEKGTQLGGFAIRQGLEVERHPDVVALNTTGGLRSGVDVSVSVNGTRLRLLGVHLKSGCFGAPLQGAKSSCHKLKAQLPRLEEWIDARAAAGEPFIVLGDFNRHLRTGEAFYSELDDGVPPNADLTLLTDGRKSNCWSGEYPDFIDHIAVSKDAAPWVLEGSFAQQLYDEADAPHRKRLSDHCPISIVLRPGRTATQSAGAQPSVTQAAATQAAATQPSGSTPSPPAAPPMAASPPIKGNLSSHGKKLYHAPGCPQYERVQIDPNKGERLFATEVEARAAGWQKAPGCP